MTGKTQKQATTGGELKQQDQQGGVPANVDELEGLGSEGFEDADSDSYAIPFLQILQSNSPQVKRSEGAFIKGAAEGMVLNNVSNELFNQEDEGVTVVPVDYRRAFTAWVPRDDGGGFRGEVSTDDPVLERCTREGSKLVDPESGLEYVDTRYHYVMVVRADGSYEPALITMTSTQIKKSRQIMTRLRNVRVEGKKGKFTPPTYANALTLYTTPESNDQGSWFGWKPDFGSLRLLDFSGEEKDLFAEAKSFRDQLRAGEVREQVPDHEAGADDDSAAEKY